MSRCARRGGNALKSVARRADEPHMANWNKKVNKAAKDELQTGEQLVASVFL